MSSTKKNIAYNVIYQVLIIFIPLITSPYLSRILGTKGIGIYSYTYSIAGYFVLFAMLGITNYGNKSISAVRDDKDKTSKLFCEIYGMQMITASITLILYILYVLIFAKEYKIISLMQTIYVFSALLDINWLFFGLGKFKITVIRNAIIKILTLVLIFVFIKNSGDLWKYTLIITIGTLISQSYVWIFLRKNVKLIKPKFNDIIKHFKPNFVLFIPVLSYSVYKIMDKIMIGNICDIEFVGLYENAEKIINIPQGVISAVGTVMISKMSNMVKKVSVKEVDEYIEKSMKYVLIIAIAMSFGMFAVGKEFAPIYFGEKFAISGILIQYMSCIIVFISVANIIRTQYLIPYSKDKLYVMSTIIGAIVNFIFNIILIPKINAYGAAIGTILAEFSVMIVQLIGVRNELNIKKYIHNIFPFIIFGLIMNIAIYILSCIMFVGIRSIIIKVIVGAVIYISLCIAYLFKTKDEEFLKIIKKVKFRRIKNG